MRVPSTAAVLLVPLLFAGVACEPTKVTVAQICVDEMVRASVVVDGYLREGSMRCGSECAMALAAEPEDERSVDALVRMGKYGSQVELINQRGVLYDGIQIRTANEEAVPVSAKLRLEGKVFTDSDGCKMRVTSIARAK